MGTRSKIIAKLADNRWHEIYVHWDGYVEEPGVGHKLVNHYTDPHKIEELIALGDLSSLGAEIGTKHPFDGDHGDQCNAYGRDRGETGIEAEVFDTLAEAYNAATGTGAEFVYVWDGSQWGVGDPDEGVQSVQTVASYLAGEKTIHPSIKAFGGDFVVGKRS